MKRIIGRGLIGLIVTGLSADILYLYYVGGWVEPIRFIEITELVILCAFVVLGIFIFIRNVIGGIKWLSQCHKM